VLVFGFLSLLTSHVNEAAKSLPDEAAFAEGLPGLHCNHAENSLAAHCCRLCPLMGLGLERDTKITAARNEDGLVGSLSIAPLAMVGGRRSI
jgi:hypothetical protein